MKVIVYIFLVMICVSPFGLARLSLKYGSNWRVKDLETKDKFIYFGLWAVIALWLGLIISIFLYKIK